MSSTAERRRPAGLLLALLMAPAMAQEAAPPPELAPLFARLEKEGTRNAVLNHMEIGVRGLEMNRPDVATRSLDSALAQIETVYANNPEAAKARSLWYEEGRKDFKGEPYERVMAYYYRGLVYLVDKDYGNARASFEGGMLQDALAEEEQHRFDFALMAFLSGWASQLEKNKPMQDRAFGELRKLRPDFALPDPGHNTLLVVETGTAPRKLADGVGHYDLVYRRGKFFREQRVQVAIDGKTAAAYPMEDVFWQASTRGGRAIDRIIKGKVAFRENNQGMGTVLTEASNVLQVMSPLTDSGLGNAAGIFGVLGVTQLFVASKVQTKADTRAWTALPDAVHVYTLKARPGQQAELTFLDANGVVQPELTRTIALPPAGGLVWVRARNAPPLN
jgi:hypothetical protein